MESFNSMNILVINAGSSSHKVCFYCLKDTHFVLPIWKGTIDWSGQYPHVIIHANELTIQKQLKNSDRKKGIESLLETVWQGPTKVIESLNEIDCIGHRVVHGGSLFEHPVIITASVKEQIRKLFSLAPLHNPASLEEIELFQQLFPSTKQIAVFDTTFHLSMPEENKTYPIPKAWRNLGIQRYGFHGISHAYCAERISILLKNPGLRIVNCHLGNGCSLCAIRDGKSVATTMGFTPLEGLMMGTRSGSIDPSILIYLMQEHHLSPKDLEKALNFESGLKGVAGLSDMRQLLTRKDKDAQLAIKMFVDRLKRLIAEMAVALGGMDVLSFTGGIGENAALIRARTCRELDWLGLKLDERLNEKCEQDQEITGEKSLMKIVVIHTQEEWMMARACINTR
jgi:acetate kinase